MRGNGLFFKKKYRWAKQPNGLYSIFDVDFFRKFNDEKLGEVNDSTAKEILRNFQEEKARGHYGRVHVGHHKLGGVENNEPAGFFDNLRFHKAKFYADLVEIPPEIFQRIRGEKLAYRSAEYNPEQEKITSIALLPTRSPHFKYPLLVLENKPVALDEAQLQIFQERCDCMAKPDDEKKLFEDDEINVDDIEEDGEGLEEEIEDEGDDIEDIEEGEDNVEDRLATLEELVRHLIEIQEGGAAEGGSGSEPAPVAMQSRDNLRLFQYLQGLETKIDKVVSGNISKRYEQELENVCAANGLNFQEERACMNLFQEASAKKAYLKTLKTKGVTYTEHPATQFAESFSQKLKHEIGKEFSGADRPVADRAFQDYRDTILHLEKNDTKRLKLFQSQFSDAKAYAKAKVMAAKTGLQF